MDYYKIGQRIRKARKAHRLSQEELAEKINISTTHMSHIETGNTKLSLAVLVDIAAVLETSTDDLLSDDHMMPMSKLLNEIEAVLGCCTPQEAKVILDVVRAVKLAMDKYM